MARRIDWALIALSLILLLEFSIFSGSFDKFFNHDSLFYILYSPHSWEEFAKYLYGPDPASQYRPLTLGLMGLMIPIFGLDPRPYHWIPIVFHLLNTVLFYCLARRLMPCVLSALAATGFWGLHSVAGWITYDITYLSDFLMAFLILSSLILAVDGYAKKSHIRIAGSVVLFLAALLTKEAAITFPIALLLCLVLVEISKSNNLVTREKLLQSLKKVVPLTGLVLSLAILHAGLLLHWLQAGLLYPQGINPAYQIDPTANLLAKTKYLYWALNLPDELLISHASRNHFIVLVLMCGLLLIWLLELSSRKGKLSYLEWGGVTCFAGLIVPAMLLSNRLGKWYLYVPIMGVALAFGSLAGRLRERVPRLAENRVGPAILTLLLTPVLISSVVQTRSFLISSDSSYASDVVQNCLRDFQEHHPTLPSKLTLFVLPTSETNVAEFFGLGKLYQLYYPESRVEMLFADKGDKVPADYRSRADVWIIQYLQGHVYDVTDYCKANGQITLFLLPTREREVPEALRSMAIAGSRMNQKLVRMLFADEGDVLPEDYFKRSDVWILQYMNGHFTDVSKYYKGRRRDFSVHRVIPSLQSVRTTVSRDEFYPNYEDFGTPGGVPVFYPTPSTDIITQIAGSTAISPLPTIQPGAYLRFDVSWMFDSGDGGWAEIRIRAAGRESTLYKEYFDPNPRWQGPRWKEVILDLGAFADREVELVLRCYNKGGNTTVADWLNWRDIVIDYASTVSSKN